jgi:ribose 5-phosphate isomerase B
VRDVIFHKIYIGADHAGFALKQCLIDFLEENKIIVEDCGAYDTTPSNYADLGHQVAFKIKNDPGSGGVLMCGTGIGISMAANRHQGIRAALCHNVYTTQCARAHNDANVLALGSRILDESMAKICLDIFLKTPFEGGRHTVRVNHIDGGI